MFSGAGDFVPHHARLKGFTFIELLVAIGMIAILVAIFIPFFLSAREASNRHECANHLQLIWTALKEYESQNGDKATFPQVVYDTAKMPTGYVAFTGPDGGNPFAAGSAVQPNDITASLWLLVRDGYIKDLSVFICPSTWDRADTLTDAAGNPVSAQTRGNFRSAKNLSYSYANPFAKDFTGNFTDTLPWKFALMADKNPGFAVDGNKVLGPLPKAGPFEMARGNSPNHQHAGQNVLHPAGNVSFEMTPYCGISNDNIYSAVAPEHLTEASPSMEMPGFIGPALGPACKDDSYLVPTVNDTGK